MAAALSLYDRTHIAEIVAGQGDWFSAHLLRLIAKADDTNRLRLSLIYPDHVQAYLDWYYETKEDA